MILKAGTVKRVHVDRQILARNRKLGENKPAYTIQTSKGSIKCMRVEGYFVFNQNNPPLSCGARMYGETRKEVKYGT